MKYTHICNWDSYFKDYLTYHFINIKRFLWTLYTRADVYKSFNINKVIFQNTMGQSAMS